jgi:hypothetical protein
MQMRRKDFEGIFLPICITYSNGCSNHKLQLWVVQIDTLCQIVVPNRFLVAQSKYRASRSMRSGSSKPTCLQPLPSWLLNNAIKNRMKMVESGSAKLTSIGIMIKPGMQIKGIIGDPFHASMIECLNECFRYHGGLLRIWIC